MAGAPLPPELRRRLEARFAADLGDVRLHRGWLARRLCGGCRASAVTLGRRIYCSPEGWRRLASDGAAAHALAAHEATHVLQYRRDGLLPMLWRYAREYLAGRLRGLGHDAAYRAISYEREAFAVERAVREAAADD